jgi:tRNA uridine 5-carbamoylmethylation protein Kti12
MFVDGYTGIGKTSFAKETIREFNNLHIGETSVLLTQAPYIDNEREFILSLLREEMVFYKNMPKADLKTILLKKLSNCKYLVIDDSQNLLISRRLLMNHFLFMSWLVNETNIKVLYLGTVPFEGMLESYDTIYRRSVVYNLKAS